MMKNISAGLLLTTCLSGGALAQSNPGLIYGQIPTATQLNSYFSAKQNVLGFTPLNKAGDTMSGPLLLAPSTFAAAGLNIGLGVAPGSPNNGDMWIVSNSLYVELGGVTQPILAGGLTVGTTPVGSGTSGEILYDNAGVLGNIAVNGSGNVVLQTGATLTSPTFAGTITGGAAIQLSALALEATNTVPGNATAISASPTALSMPSCSAAADALIWTTNIGFGCNSALNAATLGSATFAAPGAIGSGTPSSGAFTTLAVSSSISGPAFSTYLTAPPPIGGITANIGAFTTLSSSSTTDSSSTSTGGFQSSGGAGVAKSGYFGEGLAVAAAINGTPTGMIMDYSSGGRLSVSGSNGFNFYNAGVGTTLLASISSSGVLGTLIVPTSLAQGVTSGSNASAGYLGEILTAQSANTSATATFTNGSAVIGWSGNTLTVGAVVYFTTSSALPTGFSANTNYYVSATGFIAGTSFEVATTPTGTPIVAASAGSGTQTAHGQAYLTSGSPANVLALQLSAGDWDCWGNLGNAPGSGTLTSQVYGWVSTSSATPPSDGVGGGAFWSNNELPTTTSISFLYPVGMRQINVSGATTLYLESTMAFSISTEGAYGFLGCRRVH